MFNLIDTINPEICIRELKNKHEGKIAVLVGTGPSVLEENTKKFFEKANEEKYIYFTNNQGFLFDTIKNLFKTDYYLISDPKAFNRTVKGIFRFEPSRMKIVASKLLSRKIKIEPKKSKKVLLRRQKYKNNFHHLGNDTNLILKEFINIPEYYYTRSSIYISLQLILFFGIKKIYLVGCDCCSRNSHSIPKLDNVKIHGRGPKNFHENLVKCWEVIYQYLKEYYPSIDIQVVSPKGLKSIIPGYTP